MRPISTQKDSENEELDGSGDGYDEVAVDADMNRTAHPVLASLADSINKRLAEERKEKAVIHEFCIHAYEPGIISVIEGPGSIMVSTFTISSSTSLL